MTQQDRETLERLTDFNYARYKEEVLDKQEHAETATNAIEEPPKGYENIPPHHMKAIEAGLADLEAGRMISGEDFRKKMRKRFGI